MKRLLITLSTLLVLSLAAAQSAAAEAGAQAQARFYAEAPQAGAEVVAETTVAAAAELDLEDARYVVLETAEGSYTFALDTAANTTAEAQGQVMLTVDGSAQTLSEVAAELQAATEAQSDLAVFTEGAPEGGLVLGIYALNETAANHEIDIKGATHVQLFKDGETRSLRVDIGGNTLAEVTVESEVEGNAESESQGLLDVGVSLGADVDASVDMDVEAETDDAEASSEADAGIGIGIGIGGN